MKITVSLENGFLLDKYSKYASEKVSEQPVISFPIKIEDLPKDTRFLAVSLIDYDAVPRTGFPFIHWLAADVPATTEIPEDLSRNFDGPQGKNSWNSRFYDFDDQYVMNHYAGPVPPDKPHHYTVKVYALNSSTNLEQGFFLNEFYDALKNKTIAEAETRVLAVD